MTVFYDNIRLLILTIAIILVGGLSALFTMPQEEDPKITNRFATIVTSFPGASASRVEALVTEKIENELREIAEIEEISSTSRTGISVVTVELKDTIYDTDGPSSIIRDALADAERNFPANVPPPEFDDDRTYPFTIKVGLTWEATSEPSLLILKRIAEDLQDRLRNVPGTEYVELFGAPREEIVVSINAAVVESLGLSRQDIAQAIGGADSKVSAGQFRGNRNEYIFEVRGELNSLDRLREVPIRQDESGAIVRVGDVGRVDRRLVSPPDQRAQVNGKPAVVIATRLESNLRVGDWSAQVRERIAQFEETLSAGIGIEIIFDQSAYSEERFSDLINNLLVGAGLVVAVLFITLGWRSSLIVAAAIPMTGLASLVALNIMGFPINQMSITGLIVALGLLVDAAIVMTDAIRRRLLDGLAPREAVRVSVARLWVPLFSSTLTTVLAFAPISLLPGAVGEFVGPISASVISMLVLSFLLALTIGAALSGIFLPGGLRNVRDADHVPFWIGGISVPVLGGLFRSVLRVSLKVPRLSILAALVLPFVGFAAMPTLPDAFFPEADRNQFHIQLRLPSQRSIEETTRVVDQAYDLLMAREDIESVQWYIGSSVAKFYYNLPSDQDGVGSFAEAMVTTKSLRGMYDLINDVQHDLDAAFPNAQFVARQLLQGPPVAAPVELRFFSEDLTVLQDLGEKARLILSRIPQVTHSTASIAGGEPKLWLNADQDDARQAGLSLVDIAGALDSQLEGTFGGTIVEGSEELRVRVRLDDEARSRFEELASLYVLAPSGPGASVEETGLVDFQATPISALGDIVLEPEASVITHYQGERVNTVLGYIEAGTLPSTALAQFRRLWEEAGYADDMPPGSRLSVGGDAEARSNAVGALLASVGLIVVLMIATVVLTFSSFRLSAVVFAVAFLSMGLGILALAVFDFPFGFQPLIGIIGLIGVAINAAIIILSALRLDPAAIDGDPNHIEETVMEASRHIVSTTLTTFGGFLPLILSVGGFWPPFATAIAVGVLLSTVISFFFVPQMFLLITRSRPVRARIGVGA